MYLRNLRSLSGVPTMRTLLAYVGWYVSTVLEFLVVLKVLGANQGSIMVVMVVFIVNLMAWSFVIAHD